MTGGRKNLAAPPERPWMVPAPVRRSSFVPLLPEHARYNVEVDLGRIEVFGKTTSAPRPDELLFSDLQLNADSNQRGRLGSGRAGVYVDRYLKGIGRTLLAGNWANPADALRHTGFLFTSSAIRELVASAYLEAKGHGAIVNRCEGILVKPMPPKLRALLAEGFRGRPGYREGAPHPYASDLELHAVSIKGADFVRYSNLLWYSQNLDFHGPRAPLSNLVLSMLCAVDGGPPPKDATPEDVATSFFRSIDNAMDTMRRCWRLGVSWGSLHNNFCADGRFHDLEGPFILGKPLLGIVCEESRSTIAVPHRELLWGLYEVFALVFHHRMLAWAFQARFQGISRMGSPVGAIEREFAAEVANELEAAGAKHALFDEELLKDRVVEWVRAEVDLSESDSRRLRETSDIVFRAHLGPREGVPRMELPLSPRSSPLARSGGINPVPHCFDFVAPGDVATEEAAFVNGLLSELDRIGDVDGLLVATSDALAKIRAFCKPDLRSA